MRLTKYEKETHLNYTQEDEYAMISTFDSRLKRRLLELSKTKPEECSGKQGDLINEAVYFFPKKWVRINPPRTISDKQRTKQIENLRNKGS